MPESSDGAAWAAMDGSASFRLPPEELGGGPFEGKRFWLCRSGDDNRQRLLVQCRVQDVLDSAVAHVAEVAGTCAGGFQPFLTDLVHQPEQRLHRAESVEWAVGQELLNHRMC